MPPNSQGTIQVFSDAIAQASYAYAAQDTGVFLSSIPSGGTALLLPLDPNDGDWYEFEDTDGSCSSTHPIVVTAAEDTTIQGAASITLINPYSAGVLRYSTRASNWVFSSQASASSSLLQTAYGVSTGQAVTESYALVAGCSLTVEVTGPASKILFWAALSAIGTSESAGIVAYKVILDPAGANTTVAYNAVSFAADLAEINAGSVAGEITGLAAGPHVVQLQVTCNVSSGLAIGTLAAAEQNASILLQVIG